MSWFKKARKISKNSIIRAIKKTLRTHPFFQQLMVNYGIPSSEVDEHLKIIFMDLNKEFAKGNGKEIKIDNSLLQEDFLKDNFHFVAHEFFHWIKRRAEARFYFSDDEEIQSFVVGIAWDLISGKNPELIRQTLLPIIEGHFRDETNAAQLYDEMYERADIIAKRYK
jgi:hypothetical protein